MNIQQIINVRVSVSRGENAFTMSRGSFSYRQKLGKKRPLTLRTRIRTKTGYRLNFVDKATGEEHVFEVLQEGERITLTCRSGNTEETNRYWLTFPAGPREHFYGCGETWKLDLKGEKVRIWVAEHQNTNRISGKILREKVLGRHPEKTLPFRKYESYHAQPTFVSSAKYFVHCPVQTYCEFDFSLAGRITLYFQEPPVVITESGGSFEALSRSLGDLLGRPEPLPDWVYDGAILAMQDWTFDGKETRPGYDGCGNVERKLARAKEAGLPVTAIWCQDWCGCRTTRFGYQVMWNWVYDPKQYPRLPEKIRIWREQGVGFLGYINPFLALEKELYQEAKEKGYCVKDRKGRDYLVTITTFPAAMVDFTNPEAYEWYKGIIRHNMVDIGMVGWMADFGEYLPVDAVLYSGEDPAQLHNRWPVLWARLNREAIEESGKLGEVFFFTRAGFTGTSRWSLGTWTGDQHVDWSVDDGLPSVIPSALSLGMSGCGLTHFDVGGYTTILHMTRSRELLLRWAELGIFSPVFRTHEGNQPARNVQYDGDDELLEQMAKDVRLHVALKDYLKEQVQRAAEEGIPVMRPLFYHYDEADAWTEQSEYLLGRDILVAPVLQEGAESRTCYLPRDSWVHLASGREFRGGIVWVDAHIGELPVFVRKDSGICRSLRERGFLPDREKGAD